jgi:uncharacterized membrane protein YqjE
MNPNQRMDPQVEPEPESVKASTRRLSEVLLRTLQNRAELFGLELETEGRWVVTAFVWTSAAVFFTVLAITIVTLTLVILLPAWRGGILIGSSVLYIVLAATAIAGLMKHVKARRPPLSDTVNELRKDLEWIQSRD